MTRLLIVFAAVLASFAGRGEPLGFWISSATYDSLGVQVAFETDRDPPYEVGVWRAAEIGLGRCYPMACVTTDVCVAYLPGDFLDASVFVQVGCTGRVDVTRSLTRREFANYCKWVADKRNSWATNVIDKSSFEMFLAHDYEWRAFVKSSFDEFEFTPVVRKAVPDSIEWRDYLRPIGVGSVAFWQRTGEIEGRPTYRFVENVGDISSHIFRKYSNTNAVFSASELTPLLPDRGSTNQYRIAFRTSSTEEVHAPWTNWVMRVVTNETMTYQGDVSIGRGYRVVHHERTGVYDVERAYSALPDASDELLLPRAWKAYSTHNGFKFTQDYYGSPYFNADTNAVPHRIYGGGL